MRRVQLSTEDMVDLTRGHTINVEDDSGYELVLGAEAFAIEKQHSTLVLLKVYWDSTESDHPNTWDWETLVGNCEVVSTVNIR